MDSTTRARYLAPSRLVDTDHPAIFATVRRVTANTRNDVERALKLHDFVRDQILFGWAPQFDAQTASEVLACGIGFCNTKSTLLTALLRAAAIPARIHCASINRKVLDGLIRPPSKFVDHSFVELWLNNRWIGIDSYIVDSELHRAALAQCLAERRILGYGIHTGGSLLWDGQTNCFAQFVNDGSAPDFSNADLGSFDDLDAFRASGLSRNPTHLPARLVIRILTRSANTRVAQLRHRATRIEN